MNRLILIIFLALSFVHSSTASGSKIKAYFNQPVNTSFSHGSNAVYLLNLVDDTLVAYINRAQYTLDIAIYELQETSGMADIIGAINAAYTRGVAVRIIYDGKDSLSRLNLINASIPMLPSPGGSNYNIMHNKFVIIDANSPTATDPVVWTGSFNWTVTMFKYDYNNALVIQDQPLAQAYLAEFNQMWGSTTATPNTNASKFGQFKTPTTAHTFTIDGHQVELYFSPSDSTNSKILTAINSADRELFFGIYTFTETPNANAISAKYSASGMTVKGIMDEFSQNYSYATLSPVMGANLKLYTGSYVYHNKMMIVDPDYTTLDPLVTTGSHNWSVTADTKNDENMVIVHDSTIANQYLQSFAQNFIALGGTITPVHTTTGIETMVDDVLNIYPNPTHDNIQIDLSKGLEFTVTLTDISGQVISTQEYQGSHATLSLASYATGSYFVSVSSSLGTKQYRVVKL